MELAKRADLYSKQVAKGSSLMRQKQKLLKKETKRAGAERVLGCWSLQGISFMH